VAAIPVLGWIAVIVVSFAVTCAAAGVSLFVAGVPTEDFRVADAEAAARIGVGLATARWVFDLAVF
jgi:hypothetical protein